jgi:hypothetical protein
MWRRDRLSPGRDESRLQRHPAPRDEFATLCGAGDEMANGSAATGWVVRITGRATGCRFAVEEPPKPCEQHTPSQARGKGYPFFRRFGDVSTEILPVLHDEITGQLDVQRSLQEAERRAIEVLSA